MDMELTYTEIPIHLSPHVYNMFINSTAYNKTLLTKTKIYKLFYKLFWEPIVNI